MDDVQIQRARDSLSRCIVDPAFLDRFYEKFMASSKEIEAKFAQTDFDRQKKVLQDSLFVMLVSAGAKGGLARKELSKLAERHSRENLDIKPEWYESWLDSLVEAVAETDPSYSEEIGEAWRSSLRPGIAYLTSRYAP